MAYTSTPTLTPTPTPTPTPPAVETTRLTKSYGTHRVLAGVDLRVAAGTVFALLGPNGAGKTTLISILSTLLRPDAGTARVDGHDVVARADAVRSSISLTGQFAAVDELLTGRENLVMMGRLHHLGRGRAAARADQLLARFGLADAGGRLVKTYSGGMRRRLDIAASLVVTPRVLFLDEPTTGLDPHSRQDVWTMVRGLVAEGVTVLLTTQYLEEADALADEVAVIDGGRIVVQGSPARLKAAVGADRLEVSFADGTQTSIATDGSLADLRRALDALAAEGRDVVDVALRKPSLDDVFLALVGRATSPGGPTPPEEPRGPGEVAA